jgi:Ca-activated chloride channel family protein
VIVRRRGLVTTGAGTAALALMLAAGGSAYELAARTPSGQDKSQIFRAGVEMVSLNVTVTDGQGRFVTNLARDDFAVFEDGVKQDLTFFNHSNLPIALSLLIDTSASMEQRLSVAQDAAIGFARKIRPQDVAQVVDFDSRVEITQGFTNNIADLEKAIRATSAGGSTALHNAVYIALKELAKVKAKDTDEIRRQAIVLLSDGEDTSSLVSFDEVLELAKRSETAVYTIGLQPREPTALKGFREAEFVLKQFALETGGRSFFVQKAEELKDVYGQIADELSTQYAMGYAPKNPRRDGAFRRIVVQVNRGNVTARTKRGYYAPVSH